jgi:hypothetical protein
MAVEAKPRPGKCNLCQGRRRKVRMRLPLKQQPGKRFAL